MAEDSPSSAFGRQRCCQHRRQFLRTTAYAGLAIILPGCAAPPAALIVEVEWWIAETILSAVVESLCQIAITALVNQVKETFHAPLSPDAFSMLRAGADLLIRTKNGNDHPTTYSFKSNPVKLVQYGCSGQPAPPSQGVPEDNSQSFGDEQEQPKATPPPPPRHNYPRPQSKSRHQLVPPPPRYVRQRVIIRWETVRRVDWRRRRVYWTRRPVYAIRLVRVN